MSGLSDGLIPTPTSLLTLKLGPKEKSPFQIAVKQLEIDENVNRVRLMRHFLSLNLCLEQSWSFRQILKWWSNADWTHCVRPSSAMVVITLFFFSYWKSSHWVIVDTVQVSNRFTNLWIRSTISLGTSSDDRSHSGTGQQSVKGQLPSKLAVTFWWLLELLRHFYITDYRHLVLRR